MADEPAPEHPSLNCPAMSNVTVDIERRGGARPRDEPVYTTRMIREEIQEAATEDRAAQLAGTDFYLPLTGQPRISQMRSWRGPVTTEQGNPGIYVQIDEWIPLYKGNVYVVDEVTGRMYLSKKSHLMRIPEMASHRPMQDHELSVSRHIPERETDPTPRVGDGQNLKYPQTSVMEEQEPTGGESTAGGDVSRTPQPVETSTPQTIQRAPSREGTEGRKLLSLINQCLRQTRHLLPQRRHRDVARKIPPIRCLRLPCRQHLQDPLGQPEPGIDLAKVRHQAILRR